MTSHPHTHPPRSSSHHPALINQIPPNPKRRLSDDVPPFLGGYVPTFSAQDQRRAATQTGSNWEYWIAYLKATVHGLKYYILNHRQRYSAKDFLDVRLLLIILWILILQWGERWAFDRSIGRCDYRYWEQWPPDANPHHVVLVADPQLVDPHTYPGRPWPLSTATVWYTDAYMRKSFRRTVSMLEPQSLFFLGDLFDGGREWSPPGADEGDANKAVEQRWKGWSRKGRGAQMWFQEYERFGRVFMDPWVKWGERERRGQQRKIVTSLPGNHDLGLGNGIRIPVRKRFNAYFGAGNRIDVVGNHTFVSLDTVSLSAKGQPDSVSLGLEASIDAGKAIWEPAELFLHEVKATKGRAISRYLRFLKGETENPPLDQHVVDLSEPAAHTIHPESAPDTDVPSILLTHVPFYRPVDTPCGAFREHWPPSNPSTPDEKDERNSIHVAYGTQYQNVLTSQISNEIVDLVGDITHIFSGDDHDYCDVLHREYTAKGGGIREITVKSLSWAMGVRKPGFVILSLWNPLDANGKAFSVQKSTVQSHLCLLPDQLAIFIRYAWLLVFTIATLLGQAIRKSFGKQVCTSDKALNGTLLPTLRSPAKSTVYTLPPHSASSSTSNHGGMNGNGLQARAKPRASSPAHDYGYMPHPSIKDGDAKGWDDIDLNAYGTQRYGGGFRQVLQKTRRSVRIVAVPVGLWYFWLLWQS